MQSVDHMTTRDMIRDVTGLLGVVLRELAKLGDGLSEEVAEQIHMIESTISSDPGQLLDKMLEDIRAADVYSKGLRQNLQDLYGDRDFHRKNTLPKPPEKSDLKRGWAALRKTIKMAFGFDLIEPVPEGVEGKTRVTQKPCPHMMSLCLHSSSWLHCSTYR